MAKRKFSYPADTWKHIHRKVCALLGQAKLCPQARPIALRLINPGKAEVELKEGDRPRVCPFMDLKAEDQATIVCLAVDDSRRLHKLMALGVLPGLRITMKRKFPSCVFQIGQSQFAVDRQIAEGIYVDREQGRPDLSSCAT